MKRQARIAGVFYVLTIVTGMLGALLPYKPQRETANLAASACFFIVTVMLYLLFRPRCPLLSLVASIFSVAGCVLGALDALHMNPYPINNLVFYGCYCVLLGTLILRTRLMPRWLGVLVAIAGLGWLTFAYPPLARSISPLQMLTGLIGEGVLTAILLAGRFSRVAVQTQSATAIPSR